MAQESSAVSYAAAEISGQLDDRLNSLEAVARMIDADLLRRPDALQKLLDQQFALHTHFNNGVMAYRRDGTAIAVSPASPEPIGVNYIERDYLRRAINDGAATVGRPIFVKSLKAPIFVMAVPVRDSLGNIVGALSGVTSLGKPNFLDKITGSHYGKTGGYLIAAPKHDLIVTATDKSRIMEAITAEGVNAEIDHILRGGEGSGVYTNELGAGVLWSAKEIPTAGWSLVANLPLEEALAPIHGMQRSLLFMTAFLTLLAGGLMWWWLRRQLSPLVSTAASLDSLVESNTIPEFLPIKRLDEIGLLIGSFNRVCETLEKRERDLLSSEKRYRSIFESSQDAICISRVSDDTYLEVNQAFCDATGYEREEVLGRTALELNLWCDPEDRTRFFELLLRESRLKNEEIFFKSKSGSIACAQFSATITEIDGVPCVLCVSRDVTKIKRVNNDLIQSNSRLESLIRAIPDMVWLKDVDGRYQFCNQQFANYLGAPEQEIIGKTDFEIVGKEDAESFRAFDEATIEEGQTIVHEQQVLLRGTQQKILLETSKTPVFDSRQQLMGVLGIGHDITVRKQTEAELDQYRHHLEELVAQRTDELAESENNLKNILDLSADGIYWIDLEGRVNFINPSACAMLGYMPEQLLGKVSHSVIHYSYPDGTFYPAEECFCRKALDLGERVRVDKEVFWHADGHQVHVMCAADPMFHDGVVTGAVVSFVDISRQHHAEEARKQALQAAESANRSKSLFLANMSHEIRTPLNGIIGMTHVLQRGATTPEQASRLVKVNIAAEHLLSLINDILDLSKIEAGRVVLEESTVSVGRLLGNVNSITVERARSKGLDLQIKADWFPPNLVGDTTRLQQALLNYVTNAIKFTETGTVAVRAVCQEEKSDSVLVRFEVHDSGIGISNEVIPRLFSAFEQAEESTTRKFGGTGLGLAITKRLAEMMGGEAGVTSKPGVGSTFWFTARLRKGETQSDAATAEISDAENVIRQSQGGRHVLVVDDDHLNREVAQFLLEEAGLLVDTAADGMQAVSKVREVSYALILMDMQMPNLDGINATKEIRGLPLGHDVPVLALTANAFAEDRVRCLEAGMNDFLAKPFDTDALYAVVLKWLERYSANASEQSAAIAAQDMSEA